MFERLKNRSNIERRMYARFGYDRGNQKGVAADIAEAVGMSVSAVSHQLRVLRTARLVRGVKEGKEVRYALDDEHVKEILDCGLEHVGELH